MLFVPNKLLLEKAMAEGYAVGAFNTNNLETTRAIVRAARELDSPLILATSEGAINYAGINNLKTMAEIAAQESGLPISLHLDHGTSLEIVMRCIRHGWSSVMYDGSKLPFEENVANARQVVELAHLVGVSVEGELGRLVGVEDNISVTEREAAMTDPDQAQEFVKRTGVDALAVAIGNAHGFYKGEPQLDFIRLEQIRARVEVPLVLHGASGIPDEGIRRAVKIGVDKINIDTEVRAAFQKAVASFLAENPQVIDPRKILGPAIKAMSEVVKSKIELFGSVGKA
ncbi:fructose-bisphosphate aldolase, class II [Candidatus Hakubella thermalkaliphila]|uniref:Fructose-bisphosphate aldolase, class II n=2 Tax=Candidatus Hakubella thermalkaliphila TaxID=2754717 RepID=A0A6V8PQ55_9ACTN|nr:class II fructose-1,6-bisphosphate aldolase [Candidatus Hakubella thermalkaliphila]GFP27146.1 fructose-bisphosphate aldolase, class II [Candidatus Hakubella thermalkaliphila]GFP34303.1 fructose-bisphosphate aldolase, class II [Candidatus Hakubella thermalkaliphila]GFP42060.1 fructose-bisphosphate aldolase, class II [Candidatus Hakubella thermalkaliphila]